MIEHWYDRSQLLLGQANLEKLSKLRVAVFGVGGVGGAACEALVRTGIGFLRIIDGDVVAPSNLNRQLIATSETLGQSKVEAAARRLLAIRPDLKLERFHQFILPGEEAESLLDSVDIVLDCIDTVTAKLFLIETCIHKQIPIYSAMGAGNRLDPTQLQLTDISKTHGCRLARVMRRELRKRGILHLPVVFSPEPPKRPFAQEVFPSTRPGEGKLPPGSLFFPPVIAGTVLAYQAIHDALQESWPEDPS